jgi:hypothetical protein
MSETRWLVELLLPGGTFEVRSVVTERTMEQYSAEIHASVADLLAWKPHHVIDDPFPVTLVVQQQQQVPQLQRRLLMAHSADEERALKIASDLRAIFPHTVLPWSENVRQAFDAYLQGVME